MSQNLPNTQKGKATRQWLLDNTVAQNYDEEAILHSDVQKDANLFKRQLRDAQADHLQPTRSLENLQRELEEEEELEQWSQADLKDVRTFTNTFKKKIPYYVPMFKWVRSYSKDDLIGDVLAAITTATMLVPQGLAYAILAGLPPVLGLYTGWMPLIVYSVMGGCKQLAIGPEALLAVLLGSLLDRYEVHEAVEVAHMMAFVVGIISFIFGAVRFGFMHNVISRWVLAGFINAVALIIALSQLDTLLGFKFERGLDPYEKFIYACVHIKNTNGHTIGMAIAGITFLFLMKYLKGFLGRNGVKNAKYIPDVMMLVIGGIVFMYFTRWNEDYGVKVLGTIEGGFPKPITPQFNLEAVQELAGDCLLIVIVGFVEATAVSRTLATKHGYQISSNRELVAFGIANLLGSFFQIYPCFASIPRTSIQDAAGSRTCLCGFLVSCFCLIVVLFLTPLFYYLPNVVMGSIIFVAAFGLVEIHEAQFLWKTKSWKDFAQFWIAALATFILGVELGVLTAVGMCIFLVLKQASTPQVYSVLGRTEDGQFKDVSKFPDASAIEGVILVRIDEILTFANMGEFKLLLENLESIKDSTEGKKATIAAVVLNFRNMSSLDASALLTFDEMIHAYHSKGIKVGFVEVSSTVMDRFAIAGLKELVGNEFFFETNQDAVDYIETNVTKTKQVSSPTVPAASSATTGESSSSSYQRDYSEPQAEDLPTIPSTPTISEGKLVDNDILVDTADSDDDASPSLPTSHALLHSSSDHHHDYMDPANNRDPY